MLNIILINEESVTVYKFVKKFIKKKKKHDINKKKQNLTLLC